MITVGIYARQSVEKKDSVSIQTQIDECKGLVKADMAVQIYQDEGFSGKNTERPDLQRMLEDIEMGLLQKVIVYKLDRISRNTVDFYNLYDFMKKHKCEFTSVVDGFDTSTPQGRFLMNVLASFAEMERENIIQRVKDSYYMRAKTDGRWLGGREPFGFSKGKTEGKSTLIPNDKIRLVIDFYSFYSNGTNISLHQLVAYAKEHYDVKMSATQVRNILSNSLYVKADKKIYDYYKLQGIQFLNDESEYNGIYAMQLINKTDQSSSKTVLNDTSLWIAYLANWKGIVSSREFLICQERLKQNKSYASSNKPTNKMLELSGLIKCSKCGYSVKMKGKYGTLSCTGRSEFKGYCNASFAGVKLQNIQELVGMEVQNYLDVFSDKLKEELNKKQAVKRKISKIKKDIDRLFEIAEQSDTLQKATLDRITKKQNELTECELLLMQDVYVSDKIENRILHSIGRPNFKDINYFELPTEKKQALLRILVNKILLNEDGSISVVWNN